MISDVLAVALACLALYGAVRLAQDSWCALRALGRLLARWAEWVHVRWRARSADRERRTVKRKEGIGALNAECAADLAKVVLELQARLAEERTAREEAEISAALARGTVRP